MKNLSLTEDQKSIVLHTVGIQKKGKKITAGGWRNYFAADKNHNEMPEIENLIKMGWMKLAKEYEDISYFTLTKCGITALKLAGYAFVPDEDQMNVLR